MWKCHKCGKPVYFAERKQSLGYDWHPECLRCEECAKRLNPGQHAEHKGVPYCHVPCYGALFGPQLFGHGTRVESHTSFGRVENRSGGPNMPRTHLESKLKLFNQFYDGNSGEIRSREVNGRLVLEGALRIHWGILGMIHLKEDDDQRTVITIRKRNSYRSGAFNGVDFEQAADVQSAIDDSGASDVPDSSSTVDSAVDSDATGSVVDSDVTGSVGIPSPRSSVGARTLPPKLEERRDEWDELDELLQVERRVEDSDKLYQTMPTGLPSTFSIPTAEVESEADSGRDTYEETLEKELDRSVGDPDPGCNGDEAGTVRLQRLTLTAATEDVGRPDDNRVTALHSDSEDDGAIEYDDDHSDHGGTTVVRRAAKTGSTAIRRRPGKRRSRTALKRRCSINGHYYDRETSFFTPPRGSNMSVWVTSLVSTEEVINLVLDKYKVDSRPAAFALFVVRDNGEQRRLRDDEYPLLVRVMLGPHEDVAKLFIMDRRSTEEISSDVAQFLNLSTTECRAILERYRMEEEREAKRVRARFREMRKRIKQRMEDLKVRL